MRVLAIIHGSAAHAGLFGEVVRENGHDLHQVSYAMDEPPRRPLDEYGAAIVFGGSMNTHEEDTHPWLRAEKEAVRALVDQGTPVLGVCLGSQLVAEVAGGAVRRATEPEIGWFEVELTPQAADDPIFSTLPARFPSLQWHSYASTLPDGAVELARSPVCLQAFRFGDRVWGTQFHAEVTRPIVETWISHYQTDPEAIALGFDPEAASAELAERIAGWNVIGRAIAGGFMAHAEALCGATADRATA